MDNSVRKTAKSAFIVFVLTKRDIGFDQDQKSADLSCATNHKYETSKNTGARAFTMPPAIGSSSLYGIKGQVVVPILAGASFLIVLIALEAAPAELTPGQVAPDWIEKCMGAATKIASNGAIPA